MVSTASSDKQSASAKGLVAGLRPWKGPKHIELIGEDLEFLRTLNLKHIRWILVVEKDASFSSMVQRGLTCQSKAEQGLLVTGKGYPDLNTRRFLRAVFDTIKPKVPIYGLFDGDPDGIDILRCYKHGSKALAQERGCNIPEMEWIGVKFDDITRAFGEDVVSKELTDTDMKKLKSMCASLSKIPGMEDCISDLEIMRIRGRKVEIQVLEDRPGGLYGWLENKLCEKLEWRKA